MACSASSDRRLRSSSHQDGPNDSGYLSDASPKQKTQKLLKLVLGKKNPVLLEIKKTDKKSILEFIEDEMKRQNLNNPTNKMLLIAPNGAIVNFGLPIGALDVDGEYECIFNKNTLTYNTNEYLRNIDVADFQEDWKKQMDHFLVELTKGGPNVCQMFRIAKHFQVPFFNGETFFDALIADGRFGVRKNPKEMETIRKCKLKDTEEDAFVNLEIKAYPGTFVVLPSNADKIMRDGKGYTRPLDTDQNNALAAENPDCKGINATPAEKKQLKSEPESFDVPSKRKEKSLINLSNASELKNAVESRLGIQFEVQKTKTDEKKRLKNNHKLFEEYHKFAVQENIELGQSHLKKLDELCNSTGAIITELTSGQQHFLGTCFRLGRNYVMTNNHVVEEIRKLYLNECYVDFSYKGNINSLSSNTFKLGQFPQVVAESSVLDYAVIAIPKENSHNLPQSVIKRGFFSIPPPNCQIPGSFITLCGHPQESRETVTNPICPLEIPDHFDPSLVISTTYYHVSTFFEGSSGSPGVLLKDGYLVVLHSGGYPLNDEPRGIEYGVLMTSIVDHITQSNNELARELFYDNQ